MSKTYENKLLAFLGAKSIKSKEVIQSLWSGYGEIVRLTINEPKLPSIVVKNISYPKNNTHPRGWNTDLSQQRKIKSYEVEMHFYKYFSNRCNDFCRVPKYYISEQTNDANYLVIEDLDVSGFTKRKSTLKINEVHICLRWLANFHAVFMNENPNGLWEVGTYWHLETRPDELKAMKESELKSSASRIDSILNQCKYQTLVHGDAKVGNFCFLDDMNSVAAVDFQYVGSGCGIKDVVYLIGSCLSDAECEEYESVLLNVYFAELKLSLKNYQPEVDFDLVEKEWRGMFDVSWADFIRFLLGWMPDHQKINEYSFKKVEDTLKKINL